MNMNIKTRISVLFCLITAAILIVFASIIYFTAAKNRKSEFYQVLEQEAINKANIFLNTEVSAKDLQAIYKNNRSSLLNEVEVAIYNDQKVLIYHDDSAIDQVKETVEMLTDIQAKQLIVFEQGKLQVAGILYHHAGKSYLLTAAAFDELGYAKIHFLLINLLLGGLFSLIIIFMAGKYFSNKVFSPIYALIDSTQTIQANNLSQRLPIGRQKDELSLLAKTYNAMLDRLEKSFEAQKSFVSNISHELRTPLSALIVELEISAQKRRSEAEYQQILANVLTDARKLVKFSNSLLDLAQVSYDESPYSFEEVRVDEILIDATQQLLQRYSYYQVSMAYVQEEDEIIETQILGNPHLLQIAFLNLMENACKFSDDHRCEISIQQLQHQLKLTFVDYGIGISAADLKYVFQPFFRGDNKKKAEGNGIGLNLTQRIIQLHQGEIKVDSTLNFGTTFTIILPLSI